MKRHPPPPDVAARLEVAIAEIDGAAGFVAGLNDYEALDATSEQLGDAGRALARLTRELAAWCEAQRDAVYERARLFTREPTEVIDDLKQRLHDVALQLEAVQTDMMRVWDRATALAFREDHRIESPAILSQVEVCFAVLVDEYETAESRIDSVWEIEPAARWHASRLAPDLGHGATVSVRRVRLDEATGLALDVATCVAASDV